MNTSTPCPITVVIPVYNEQDNVVMLAREVDNALKSYPNYELVYVDDGSSDETIQAINTIQLKNGRLTLVKHLQNAGQSTALLSGIRVAKSETIATLDGDGQNDPNDIPELLEIYKNRESRLLVAGNRAKRDDTWVRRMSSRVANHVRMRLLKDECLDTGCSLKLFDRDIFLSLPHFNHLHRFMPALFKRAGCKIINVPVNHRARHAGESKYGIGNRLFVGIKDLLGVRWLQQRPVNVDVEVRSISDRTGKNLNP
ncbi:MAG: glycosyltransferase family 2 protein [bacterium]